MSARTVAEIKLLDQLATIAHNAEIARKAWLDGDFKTVALATTAVQVGAENLDADLSDAHEARALVHATGQE